jgi:hypothetical protein
MTGIRKILSLCIVLLTLTSCIQVDTAVKVNKDGSGLIEETFLMKKDFLEQMKKMAEEMAKSMGQTLTENKDNTAPPQVGDSNKKPERFTIFDEAKLKERVKDMGEGVTYLRGVKAAAGDYEGYRAIYAFTDINKVRINQNSGEKIPSGPQQGNADDKGEKKYITFAFTKGKPSELVIRIPESKSTRDPEHLSDEMKPSQDNDNSQEEMPEQVKGIFQGMKIAMSLAVDGNILETNATYREGSKITLMEIDFGKLIETPEQLKKLSQSKPKTIEELTALIRNVPGIKVDVNREIKIRFDR